MKNINHKIKTPLIIVLVTMVTMLAWAVEHRHKNTSPPLSKPWSEQVKQPDIVYDPVLLKKFENLTHELDFNKVNCTYSGIINMVDGNDTTNTAKDISFLFCRANKNFYYSLGNTETIHEDGINIFIQHEQNKVVVSDQDINIKAPVMSIGEIQKNLRSESYELTSKIQGSHKTLSILNDHHITCKEMSVTYDTISNKLTKIYTRLSDFGDPLNKRKDRVFEVLINTLDDKGNLDLYPSVSEVLNKRGGKWKLADKYAKYELITL